MGTVLLAHKGESNLFLCVFYTHLGPNKSYTTLTSGWMSRNFLDHCCPHPGWPVAFTWFEEQSSKSLSVAGTSYPARSALLRGMLFRELIT